jgi:hypothetical protein
MTEAEIDVEIAAHLGLFRNVDLLQKGVYAIRLKMAYGRPDRTIVPTGLFSAPSSVDSFVDDHAVCKGCDATEHVEIVT